MDGWMGGWCHLLVVLVAHFLQMSQLSGQLERLVMVALLDIGQIGLGDDEFLFQLRQPLVLFFEFAALPLHQLHQLAVMDVTGATRRPVFKFLSLREQDKQILPI